MSITDHISSVFKIYSNPCTYLKTAAFNLSYTAFSPSSDECNLCKKHRVMMYKTNRVIAYEYIHRKKKSCIIIRAFLPKCYKSIGYQWIFIYHFILTNGDDVCLDVQTTNDNNNIWLILVSERVETSERIFCLNWKILTREKHYTSFKS